MDEVIARTTYRPPGVGSRLASSCATAASTLLLVLCIGFIATVVFGGITVVILWVTRHDFHAMAVSFVPRTVPDGPPQLPPPPDWVGPTVMGLIAVVTALSALVGAARLGNGTVGDAITGIEARLADGGAPDRLLVVLRVFIPVACLMLVGWWFSLGWAVLAAVAIWVPALSPSRRTAIDLLLGIHPVVAIDAKLGRAWGSGASG